MADIFWYDVPMLMAEDGTSASYSAIFGPDNLPPISDPMYAHYQVYLQSVLNSEPLIAEYAARRELFGERRSPSFIRSADEAVARLEDVLVYGESGLWLPAWCPPYFVYGVDDGSGLPIRSARLPLEKMYVDRNSPLSRVWPSRSKNSDVVLSNEMPFNKEVHDYFANADRLERAVLASSPLLQNVVRLVQYANLGNLFEVKHKLFLYYIQKAYSEQLKALSALQLSPQMKEKVPVTEATRSMLLTMAVNIDRARLIMMNPEDLAQPHFMQKDSLGGVSRGGTNIEGVSCKSTVSINL